MIESSQRMIIRNSQRKGGGINPAIRRHLELQIKTLQNAHRRDVDKSRQLLQVKEREKQHETIHIEDRQTDTQDSLQRLKCSRVYCIWWRGTEERKGLFQ